MDEILLAKYGEMALKGQNLSTFEAQLMKIIRRRLSGCGEFKIYRAQSTVYIEPQGECDMNEAERRLCRVFGISTVSRAGIVPKDMAEISRAVLERFGDRLKAAKSFKVEAKRSDKKFPLTSPQICAEIGEKILDAHPALTVDVHEPELTVWVEIRDYSAYIHAGKIHGAGGLPVGSSGRALLLLSGGIDSPVAGHMMAKRGLEISAVHFESPPYTSERAFEKVRSLAERLSEYTGDIRLTAVNLTPIQQTIMTCCPEELFTLLLRRSMVRIACAICAREGYGAIVTGESLAQVASQTLPAITATQCAATVPVLRPLIGMDKTEIIERAAALGTFDISIQPYEDCCTVFVPRHPRLRPVIEELEEAEKRFDYRALEETALNEARRLYVSKNGKGDNA